VSNNCDDKSPNGPTDVASSVSSAGTSWLGWRGGGGFSGLGTGRSTA
jgi:hypothetical protein